MIEAVDLIYEYNASKVSAIGYALNRGITKLPDWAYNLSPNRVKMLINLMTDNSGYYEIFGNDLLPRLLSDETIDDEWVEDIIGCFDGGYNIYDNLMFKILIGAAHVKEMRRIIENRCAGLITLEDANRLMAMFVDVTDSDETEVLKLVQKERIEALNKKREHDKELLLAASEDEDSEEENVEEVKEEDNSGVNIPINILCAFPMHGLPLNEVEERRKELFAKACEFLNKNEIVAIQIAKSQCMPTNNLDWTCHAIDQIHKENVPAGAGRIWYLGDSIQLLDNVDLVIFGDNWKEAKGCNVEMMVCKQYGIPFIVEGEDT